MSALQEYKDFFKPDPLPDALAKLIVFDEKRGDLFSEGFELDSESSADQFAVQSYSDDPEFLKGLQQFAQADGTGSSYAIWRQGSLDDSPIVILGSEGGIHIVASNLLELLRILTFDAEPMASHERVTFYKDEEEAEASDGAADYAKWLAKTFKLKPVKDGKEVDQIVKKAQKSHDKAFRTWLKKYYSE